MEKIKDEKEVIIDIHAKCGECGRKMVEHYRIDNRSKKELHKLIDLYAIPYNMACKKCSNK
ncbi:hypothetical protein M0R04_11125 [Candidatus Dojkabacteria bacterium]|jgi:hypothetical protein|nr:hypothetical protein [Candidatus Dojkabacteria bacterium]